MAEDVPGRLALVPEWARHSRALGVLSRDQTGDRLPLGPGVSVPTAAWVVRGAVFAGASGHPWVQGSTGQHAATLLPRPGGLELSDRGKFNFYKIDGIGVFSNNNLIFSSSYSILYPFLYGM